MLSNLNTNMKILIGISSITILGIIYAFIKNMFKPKNKMIEGNTNNQNNQNAVAQNTNNPNTNNKNIGNNDIFKEFKKILTDIKKIQEDHFLLVENNHIEQFYPKKIKKHILHLDSRKIDPLEFLGLTLPIYVFALGNTNSLFSDIKNPINIKCLGVQIPYVPHNIYKDIQTLSFFTENTIDEGYYTIYTLINKINTTFSEVILSFDNVSKYVKITNASNTSMTINTDSYKLFKKLGFQNGSYTIAPSGSLVGTNIPDISIHYIDITCDQLSTGQTEHTNNGHIFKRIPFNNAIGDIIYYETPYSEYLKGNNKNVSTSDNLSSLTFSFKRDDGTYYDFKGLHFNIRLEITENVMG